MKYLALGDSYTVGEGVPAEGRWAAVMARGLRAEGIELGDPRVIAKTGWTTDDLCAAIDSEEPLGRFDFVTLLIGVNNQYRGRSVAEYRGEFGELLRRAVGFAGGDPGRVLVLSIPDWGVTPFAAEQGREVAEVAAAIDAFNREAGTVANRHGVPFVDITAASREFGARDDMLVADRLHPSSAMHALWAGAILPVARAAGVVPRRAGARVRAPAEPRRAADPGASGIARAGARAVAAGAAGVRPRARAGGGGGARGDRDGDGRRCCRHRHSAHR